MEELEIRKWKVGNLRSEDQDCSCKTRWISSDDPQCTCRRASIIYNFDQGGERVKEQLRRDPRIAPSAPFSSRSSSELRTTNNANTLKPHA